MAPYGSSARLEEPDWVSDPDLEEGPSRREISAAVRAVSQKAAAEIIASLTSSFGPDGLTARHFHGTPSLAERIDEIVADQIWHFTKNLREI